MFPNVVQNPLILPWTDRLLQMGKNVTKILTISTTPRADFRESERLHD